MTLEVVGFGTGPDRNERVKAAIPVNRLLIYGMGEGWALPCKFLGAAVPDADYPSENSRAEFRVRFAVAKAAPEPAN